MENMENVIIVGAGQNGQVIRAILNYNPNFRILGFLDDKISGEGILGPIANFKAFQKCSFFVAIGNKRWRKEAYEILFASGVKFINAIHPSAVIEGGVVLGSNVMVGALSYLNVGSEIGNNTLINNGVIVEHNCKIGSSCNINPGVVMGGGVIIGNNAFVGLGARLRDHISIGDEATVGMGSIVLRDVPANTIFFNRLENISRR
ncbi:MAG: acetyltransferase [Candidatus Vogelbacteria bacterium]|nr:acetyltransferase [Candidatus Vogelbacteria bacterium]